MKKRNIVILLLSLIAVLLVFAACNSVDEISIEKGNMPQTTYVLGHELDLSGGKLTVKKGGNLQDIDLNDKGVVVTGYDKDKLGKQELTVNYGKQSTTLTVTVVERLAAEGCETNYFVGSAFDVATGRLRITQDDGTSSTVKLDDPSVTIEGFDSSETGALTVTARYVNGTADYSGQFTVNVYNVENATFKSPNKIAYMSHDGGIDLAGGYIRLFGNGGKLERFVQITEDMVSGFNLDAATIDNRTTPVTQTVAVDYAGQHYTYNIGITFSDISVIKLRAQQFKDFDFSSSIPYDDITAHGADAIEAVGLYNNLSFNDSQLITEEELAAVARTATAYGMYVWPSAVEQYNDVFYFNNSDLYWSCESFTLAQSASEALKDEEQTFFTIPRALHTLKQLNGEISFLDYTIGDYINMFIADSATVSGVKSRLDYAIALYETLADIPADWTAVSLDDYKEELLRALSYISVSSYKSVNDRSVHAMVSSWREQDDYFEILYTYFYNTENDDALDLLKYAYLPGRLEELYEYMYGAIMQLEYMYYAYAYMASGQAEYAYYATYESTVFMAYYSEICGVVDEILACDNEMHLFVYKNLAVSGLVNGAATFPNILNTLKTTDYGCYNLASALLGKEEYNALWDLYIRTVRGYLSDSDRYLEGNEFSGNVQEMLRMFVEMSPAEQQYMLASINHLYFMGAPAMALEYPDDGGYSYFINFIGYYYSNNLSAKASNVFFKLLKAVECYSNRYDKTGALDEFRALMKDVETQCTDLRAGLSVTDRVAFMDSVGYVYDKYSAIYKQLDVEWENLGEWEKVFDELIEYIQYARSRVDSVSLFAAYEKAASIADTIINCGNEAVVNAYYHRPFEVVENVEPMSLDSALTYARYLFAYYMRGVTVTGNDGTQVLWDIYKDDLSVFMGDVAELLWTYIDYVEQSAEHLIVDEAYIKSVMAEFCSLSSDSKLLFTLLDDTYSLYYSALKQCFTDVLGEDGAAAADLLITAENTYLYYLDNPNGTLSDGTTTRLDAFKTAVQAVTDAYNQLSIEDKQQFDGLLGDTYDYYLQELAKLQD